jgi:hypothetical protein
MKTGFVFMRKPFDARAEKLVSEHNRGDKTAIELFVAGIRSWETGLWQSLTGTLYTGHQS